MITKRAVKRGHEDQHLDTRPTESLPEVALAAVASFKRQREVSDFINFMLKALEKNCDWLNGLVSQQNHFRCAVMTGAGPNRFQIQEIIYPNDNDDLRLKVQLSESDDYDEIALAGIMKLRNQSIDSMMKYIKTRMFEIPSLKEFLLKGKEMGINFALLSPINNRQFRVMERIVIGSTLMNAEPCKKRRKGEDKTLAEYRNFFGKPRAAVRH